MLELSLAVVGIDYANADRSNRRMEAILTKPGEPVDLRPEPRNKHDAHAVAVYSARGVQIGYLTAERAPFIGARIRNGEPFEAVFQDLDLTAAYIRVRFGGGSPTLPTSRADHDPDSSIAWNDDDFEPDPPASDWGA